MAQTPHSPIPDDSRGVQPAPIRPVEHEEQYVHDARGIEHHEQVTRDATGQVHREQVIHDHAAQRNLQLYKVSQFTWLIIGLIEGLIGIRIILRLIGANPENPFAQFIYSLSSLFLLPFFGLTGSPATGGMVLEIPSLIAMLVYLLIGWAIVKIVWILFAPTDSHSVSTYDRTQH
jgi:YggT family protein